MKYVSRTVIMLICLLVVGVIVLVIAKQSFRSPWELINFPEKTSFSLVNEYEKNSKTYRALYMKGQAQVRIESYRGVTSQQAKNYNRYKTMQLLGLYETARSPYPGALSDQITCEDKFKPVFEKVDDAQTVAFSGYLNSRLQYGNCTDDQVVYKSSGIMMYCSKEEVWYYLEFITPKDNPSNKAYPVKQVQCR